MISKMFTNKNKNYLTFSRLWFIETDLGIIYHTMGFETKTKQTIEHVRVTMRGSLFHCIRLFDFQSPIQFQQSFKAFTEKERLSGASLSGQMIQYISIISNRFRTFF